MCSSPIYQRTNKQVYSASSHRSYFLQGSFVDAPAQGFAVSEHVITEVWPAVYLTVLSSGVTVWAKNEKLIIEVSSDNNYTPDSIKHSWKPHSNINNTGGVIATCDKGYELIA